jgi:hypothetical protein
MLTARKYEVSALLTRCSTKIVGIIQPTNAMTILDHSLGTIEAELEKRALDVISRKTKEALNSEAFLRAADASVKAVLQLDALSITEIDVFQAVYSQTVILYLI